MFTKTTMTWWWSRSNDLSVIVEITAVYKRCCDHNIKCYYNIMKSVTPTDQYPWPTLRDSPCRLNFQYWSLLRQERLLISSLLTYVMLQVTEFSEFSDFVRITWIQGHWVVSGIGLHKNIHLPINQLRLYQNETRFSSFLSVVFYHLSSQLNLTSSITSHFFWSMKVLWASFIRHSSHRGWKFQQKTCHSLAPAIPCWSEGLTTLLKMINTELRFLFVLSIKSAQKFELKLEKPDLARVVVFVLLRFVCCIYVCDFSQFFIRCQSLSWTMWWTPGWVVLAASPSTNCQA